MLQMRLGPLTWSLSPVPELRGSDGERPLPVLRISHDRCWRDFLASPLPCRSCAWQLPHLSCGSTLSPFALSKVAALLPHFSRCWLCLGMGPFHHLEPLPPAPLHFSNTAELENLEHHCPAPLVSPKHSFANLLSSSVTFSATACRATKEVCGTK